jgi:hypothetical protein
MRRRHWGGLRRQFVVAARDRPPLLSRMTTRIRDIRRVRSLAAAPPESKSKRVGDQQPQLGRRWRIDRA